MSVTTVGELTLEKIGTSEIIITEGLDALRTITNQAALHQAATLVRGALDLFMQNGTSRTVEFVLNHNFYSAPFVPYFFKLSAEGSQRRLDVSTRGYIRAADHTPGVLTSGLVEPSILESLAEWLDG